MNQHSRLQAIHPDHQLKVSYKAPVSFDGFLNQLPDVVIFTDKDFVIKALNHAAETFLGAPASAFIGSFLEQSIPFEFVNCDRQQAMENLFANGLWNGEIRIRRNPQHEFIFNANVSLLYNEKSEVASIVFVNHNITEQRKQQRKLQFARNKYEIVVESLSEGVMLLDAGLAIDALNSKAAEILGEPEKDLLGVAILNHDWKAIKEDGSEFSVQEFPAMISLKTGVDLNEVVMGIGRKDGSRAWLSINSRAIFKEDQSGVHAVVLSFKDITKEKSTTERLKQSELLFRSFMTNSPTLGWIYDDEGNLVYGNPLFMERLGLGDASMGKNINDISSPEVARRILERNRQILEKGASVITEDELVLQDGSKRYFVANWFLVPGTNKRLIGGQAIDITDKINAREQINKMNERFTYVVNASSDAIWDLDLVSNEIYRSDAFTNITGYAKEDVQPTIEWWIEKIHSDDRERVSQKIEDNLARHLNHWEDEYRFLHADGTYRHISDKGFTIYEDENAMRQVGSMQDITERKRLEQQLLQEQVQKQKLVNQATINAQEEERNRISAELHDNVNQLLISSRLHIGVARKNPDNQDELLNKATEYLLMAVEEIRSLSKKMNSHIVSSIGLVESIGDIAVNIQKINNIDVWTNIEDAVIRKLSAEQQLMIFRIVQEQTSNIIKHADASGVVISLEEKESWVTMIISDNGKGFDAETRNQGLGFINIFNRVDAYNGKVSLVSSPGEGCRLEISFPLG